MIDQNFVIEKARYFQNVQAWPLNSKLNYIGWLNNFTVPEEISIASHLLNFFMYYNNFIVDKLLMNSIGKSGYVLRANSQWNHSYFRHSCYYSTIPGEVNHGADHSGSGAIFLNKLRTRQFDIPEGQILGFTSLFRMLEETRIPTPVFFVDDFVGSGDQCTNAFKYRSSDTGKTLNEIASQGKHRLIFSPTIINKVGYEKIIRECPDICLSCSHILGDEYNLFNPDCLCWTDGVQYNEGIDFIIRKSKEIGIPETGETGIRGYKNQGLAIAFEHGTPDATIPLFYWCDNGWTPLIEKAYERII